MRQFSVPIDKFQIFYTIDDNNNNNNNSSSSSSSSCCNNSNEMMRQELSFRHVVILRANESIQVKSSEKASSHMQPWSQSTYKSESFVFQMEEVTLLIIHLLLNVPGIFSPTVEGKVDSLQKNFQEILKKLDRILESHTNQEDDTVGTHQFLN